MSKVSDCPIVGDGRSFSLHSYFPTSTRPNGRFASIACDGICFHRPRDQTSRAHVVDVMAANPSAKCCISIFHDQGRQKKSGVRSCFCRGLKRSVALATTSNASLGLRPARRLTFTKTRLCTCSCLCSGGVTTAGGSIGTAFAVSVGSGNNSSVCVGL